MQQGIPAGGDSIALGTIDLETREAVPSHEEASDVTVDAPQTEEGQQPSQAQTVIDGTGTGKETEESVSPNAPIQKDAEYYRQQNMVVDTVQEWFSLADAGRLSEDDLRTMFERHPEIADTANHAKRLHEGVAIKERYRSLMEGKVPAKSEGIVKETTPETDAQRPLTLADLERWQKETEAGVLQKQMRSQKEGILHEISGKYSIKDQEYETFQRSTDALYASGIYEDYRAAAQAALNSIKPGKMAPLGSAPSVVATEVPAEKEVNLSVPTMLVDSKRMGFVE